MILTTSHSTRPNRKRIGIIGIIAAALIMTPAIISGINVFIAQQQMRAWQANTAAQTLEQRKLRTNAQAVIQLRQLVTPIMGATKKLDVSAVDSRGTNIWSTAVFNYDVPANKTTQQNATLVTFIQRAQKLGYTCQMEKHNDIQRPMPAHVTSQNLYYDFYFVECDWQHTLADIEFARGGEGHITISSSYISHYDGYCPDTYVCQIPRIILD